MITEDGSNGSNFSKLTFYQWMDKEYGDNWPTDDKDLSIWNRYLEYVGEYENG